MQQFEFDQYINAVLFQFSLSWPWFRNSRYYPALCPAVCTPLLPIRKFRNSSCCPRESASNKQAGEQPSSGRAAGRLAGGAAEVAAAAGEHCRAVGQRGALGGGRREGEKRSGGRAVGRRLGVCSRLLLGRKSEPVSSDRAGSVRRTASRFHGSTQSSPRYDSPPCSTPPQLRPPPPSLPAAAAASALRRRSGLIRYIFITSPLSLSPLNLRLSVRSRAILTPSLARLDRARAIGNETDIDSGVQNFDRVALAYHWVVVGK